MAQFDVHLNADPDTCAVIPYLLDVQADLLDRLTTRVVVPLILAKEIRIAAKQLNPQFNINGTAVIMSSAELAGVSNKLLGDKVISLQDRRNEIITALDILFTGI